MSTEISQKTLDAAKSFAKASFDKQEDLSFGGRFIDAENFQGLFDWCIIHKINED